MNVLGDSQICMHTCAVSHNCCSEQLHQSVAAAAAAWTPSVTSSDASSLDGVVGISSSGTLLASGVMVAVLAELAEAVSVLSSDAAGAGSAKPVPGILSK